MEAGLPRFSGEAMEGRTCRVRRDAAAMVFMDKIPFAEMWVDDPHWLPQALEGKTISAQFLFDQRGGSMLDFKIDVK